MSSEDNPMVIVLLSSKEMTEDGYSRKVNWWKQN
jgi:hypothetical protein